MLNELKAEFRVPETVDWPDTDADRDDRLSYKEFLEGVDAYFRSIPLSSLQVAPKEDALGVCDYPGGIKDNCAIECLQNLYF